MVSLRLGSGAFLILLLVLPATGCKDKATQGRAGLAISATGTVMCFFPHPATKILGASLLLAGSALSVDGIVEGKQVTQQMRLTSGDIEILSNGGKLVIRTQDGKSEEVPFTIEAAEKK